LRTRDAYFWATQGGAELDLLVLANGRKWGFEFKHSDAPGITKSMRAALETLALDHLWVVYPGAERYSLDEGLTVLPMDKIPALVKALSEGKNPAERGSPFL
jgi:predicted AAA+ superfamily ATPase